MVGWRGDVVTSYHDPTNEKMGLTATNEGHDYEPAGDGNGNEYYTLSNKPNKDDRCAGVGWWHWLLRGEQYLLVSSGLWCFAPKEGLGVGVCWSWTGIWEREDGRM